MPNTIVDILEPDDTVQILSDNLAEIGKKIPRFGCAFVIPCLLCAIGFEKY
ncbi:MAG: hypothetical protein ACTTH7_02575 [Treponema sp.]